MSQKTTTLYQRIYKDIKKKILNNQYQPGEKIPTEFEIMDTYEVSRITASRALTELSNDGFITRQRKSGSIVNDVHKRLSKTVPTNAFSLVSLIMPFSPEIGFDLFNSIQSSIDPSKNVIALYNSEKSIQKEREILEVVSKMNISGLICYPLESNDNISYFTHFIYKKTPLVIIDQPITAFDYPYVGTDNLNGMYSFTNWLIKKGHRNIAFCGYSPATIYNEKLRLKGYLKALLDNNIEPKDELIIDFQKKQNNPSIMLKDNDQNVSEITNVILKTIVNLKNPPTALMCTTDLLASYFIKQASALDIQIPEKLSITGFDNLSICEHLEVPLTTFAQDYDSIGRKAINIIKNWDSNNAPENALFKGEIIERKSVLDRTIFSR